MAILIAYILGFASAMGLFSLVSLFSSPGAHLTGPEQVVEQVVVTEETSPTMASSQPTMPLSPEQLQAIDHAYTMIEQADHRMSGE